MKFHGFVWLWILLLGLAGCGGLFLPVGEAPPPQAYGQAVQPSAQALAVGARVAARWTDGAYYPGQIAAIDGGRLSIAFDDGDSLVVAPSAVLPMVSPGSLAVGERVLAVWRDGKMYPGVASQVGGGLVTVRWDDGDQPLAVAEANVARLGQGAPSAPQPAAGQALSYPNLPLGATVAAKWKDGNYWLGQIAGVSGVGTYRVHYADGDVLDVRDDQLIPCGGAHRVGDHVMAHWKNARMYPGTISSVQGNAATVRWDDGDLPLAVPLDHIAPY